MKRFILALLIGLAVGYGLGYQDGAAGEDSIGHRILNKFGADRLKADQAAEDRRIQEAGSDSSP